MFWHKVLGELSNLFQNVLWENSVLYGSKVKGFFIPFYDLHNHLCGLAWVCFVISSVKWVTGNVGRIIFLQTLFIATLCDSRLLVLVWFFKYLWHKKGFVLNLWFLSAVSIASIVPVSCFHESVELSVWLGKRSVHYVCVHPEIAHKHTDGLWLKSLRLQQVTGMFQQPFWICQFLES